MTTHAISHKKDTTGLSKNICTYAFGSVCLTLTAILFYMVMQQSASKLTLVGTFDNGSDTVFCASIVLFAFKSPFKARAVKYIGFSIYRNCTSGYYRRFNGIMTNLDYFDALISVLI